MNLQTSVTKEWLEVEFQLLMDRIALEASKGELLEQIAAVKDALNGLSDAVTYTDD